MARTLTKKQRGFIKDYLDTGNGTLAVKRNYDVKNDDTAASMAVENLGKPKVREILDQNAEKIASNMARLALHAKRETDQISAGKDVLDRAGYKPVDKSQNVNLNVNVPNVDTSDARTLAREFEEQLRKKMQAKYAVE